VGTFDRDTIYAFLEKSNLTFFLTVLVFITFLGKRGSTGFSTISTTYSILPSNPLFKASSISKVLTSVIEMVTISLVESNRTSLYTTFCANNVCEHINTITIMIVQGNCFIGN
jgi:hypothetical protein